jgi:hypothetical protein
MADKCVYRCTDGLCGRSTSNHHCQIVTDAICESCDVNSVSLEKSPQQTLKQAISKALEVLPMIPENEHAVDILTAALEV